MVGYFSESIVEQCEKTLSLPVDIVLDCFGKSDCMQKGQSYCALVPACKGVMVHSNNNNNNTTVKYCANSSTILRSDTVWTTSLKSTYSVVRCLHVSFRFQFFNFDTQRP